MDIFWTFYLNHLSPLWGYFLKIALFTKNLKLRPRQDEILVFYGEFTLTETETETDKMATVSNGISVSVQYSTDKVPGFFQEVSRFINCLYSNFQVLY